MAVVAVVLSGCAEVRHPISPEEARGEVFDGARDVVTILRPEVKDAQFWYESCNDQGEPPFRGVVQMGLWMPGVAHEQPVDPQPVLHALTTHGWSTDPEAFSHAPTLRKDAVTITVTVAHRPTDGKKIGAHVTVNVNGQCRDTFDHRTDDSILPVDVTPEVAHT